MRMAARAEASTRELTVEGKPLTFTVVTNGEVRAAVARPTEKSEITLTAHGVPVDEVELVTLDDPLSLLSPAT
jgi:hypothetical protein